MKMKIKSISSAISFPALVAPENRYYVIVFSDEKNNEYVLIAPTESTLKSAEQVIDLLPLPKTSDNIYYIYYPMCDIKYKKIEYIGGSMSYREEVAADLAAEFDLGRLGRLGGMM